MASSVFASTALVASSRMRMRGSDRIARARATRCRCPPDRVSPRSPTTVAQRQPHLGRVALGQLPDEPVRLGHPRSALDLVVGGVGTTVGDVRADRVGEQKAVLEGHADLASQRVQRDRAEVVAVDGHPSRVRVVEARQHGRDGGFAAAAGADDRDPLAGRDAQRQVAQDRCLFVVAERDAVELDLATHGGQLGRVVGVSDLRPEVEKLKDALGAGASLLPDGQHTGELPGRGHELADVGREGQERADGDRTVQGEQPAHDQDRDLGELRDGFEQGLETCLQSDRAQPRSEQSLRGGGEAAELAPLLAEGLDHAHAGDRLVDDLRHVPLALLAVPRGREDPPTHAVGDREQQRQHDDHDGRQQRRQHEHHREREEHHQQVAGHQGQEVEQALDEGGVGVGPRHELSGRQPAQRVAVEALQVFLHVVA